MEKQKFSSVGGKRSNAGRVMDPLVDWGFKYLFGTEKNKPNLIGFLNLLLMPQEEIVDVTFMNNESLPASPEHKGCIFDIICENHKGGGIEVSSGDASIPVDRLTRWERGAEGLHTYKEGLYHLIY